MSHSITVSGCRYDKVLKMLREEKPIDYIGEIEKALSSLKRKHFTITFIDEKPLNRFFFLSRDRDGEIYVVQSFMDEKEIDPWAVGPFFSVQEATKMLMHWS